MNQGALVGQPDPSIGSSYFIADAHFGGNASNLAVSSMHWGRLVDVADKTGVVMRDFVIGGSVRDGRTFNPPSGGATITYHLTRNPITDQYTLRIGAAQDTGAPVDEVTGGSPRFYESLRDLESTLTPIFDRSLDVEETGPFSMVPRNAAAVVVFSDLLEGAYRNGAWQDSSAGDVVHGQTGQLNKTLVRVRTGYPPATPFETRVFLDPNHGNLMDRDGDGSAEYYATRVVISSTVSSITAQQSNPPLAINSTGLPESLVSGTANLAIRIPTLLDVGLGQTQIMRNASLRGISYNGNGSTSNSTGTYDIVRALRSGGSLTSDPNNGFLLDEDLPSLLGDLTVNLSGSGTYAGCIDCSKTDLVFDVTACAGVKLGDILSQSTTGGQISGVVVGWDVSGSFVTNPALVDDVELDVVVQILDAPPAIMNASGGPSFGAGSGRLGTHFVDGDQPACFVRFSPPPGIAPATDVKPNATAFLLFSEPMDPGSLKAFDTFTITRTPGDDPDIDAAPGYEYAVGRVVPTPDLRTFRWDHSGVPLSHQLGLAESYRISLGDEENGPRDLAGNPLVLNLEAFDFLLDPSSPTNIVGSFALRFENPGDDLFEDSLPEIRDNQIVYDFGNQRILPRPVTRFSTPADTSQLLPGIMTPFVGGIQTPLSNLGSKLQTLWRYADVGFSLVDETNFNIDIEGISWVPVGGAVATDIYEEFQIGLTHSEWLPDEYLDPGSGFPKYLASGLKPNFENNLNDVSGDPLNVVHPKPLGYVVSASDLYLASSGTTMLPYPLNEDLPLEDYRTYTWRDTALLALGGDNNNGAPLDSELAALGIDDMDFLANKVYDPGEIPSIGLPILMEFRCYTSEEALGLNSLDIALAANSSPRPNFRAFSTGGTGTDGLPHTVDPDTEDTAAGGYNPTSNPPGATTPGTDNTFYFGELALVTRVSRVHSVFFDAGPGYTGFVQPTIEPEASAQPTGTSIELAFRGATSGLLDHIIAGAGADDTAGSASNLNAYGNPDDDEAANIVYLNSGSWRNDISEIDNARFFQFRLTFLSNAATELTPQLRTLAFAYFKTDPTL